MADYLIDMGPAGGKGGGELLSYGTPEEVVKSTKGCLLYTSLMWSALAVRTYPELWQRYWDICLLKELSLIHI